ncbi:MAG: SAM-dependent methyltransferase [Rhodospirillaceae bacterium]|nr:SAM-dependent methyltransferase [Rhodospirillaceae bacterium]|tara:strand:- start:6374 stop:7483 length:1110 start_codon:yes stop_codon:yes gene_type:complete
MSTTGSTEGFMSMKGGGYYSAATIGAKHVIDNATPMIIEALNRMNLPDDGTTFTMSDMGCADGGTSLSMIGTVLKAIRNKVPSRPIQMIYTDLPKNDFSQVFQTVHGQTEADAYIDKIPNLYIFSSATSFHKPMFPPGTLHLGFSATASHYISEKPGIITDHIHMVGAKGNELDSYVEQGRLDWENMLLNRAQDLAPDGRLALFNFGIDERGRYLGSTGGVNMFDTFNRLWKELADEGKITQEEYLNTNFPQSYRTVEQFTAPLNDKNSPVHKAGLRLEHVETRVVNCPFAQEFKIHKAPFRFAEEYIPTLRSWSEATFANGLSRERPPAECQTILDEFYGNYKKTVRTSPNGHAMDYVHCYLIIRKEK